MKYGNAFLISALTMLLSAEARAQCTGAPAGPSPRVSRAEQAARRRAWNITDSMPQSRQELERIGRPTRIDTSQVIYSEALPDSTFVFYMFRFGADSYGIMQNRAGHEWLDAANLTTAEPRWPAALQIGTATSASARALGRPALVTTARDTTRRCYAVQARRGGSLHLHYVADTLRLVSWSLDLPGTSR
jgi:hypothetical protein